MSLRLIRSITVRTGGLLFGLGVRKALEAPSENCLRWQTASFRSNRILPACIGKFRLEWPWLWLRLRPTIDGNVFENIGEVGMHRLPFDLRRLGLRDARDGLSRRRAGIIAVDPGILIMTPKIWAARAKGNPSFLPGRALEILRPAFHGSLTLRRSGWRRPWRQRFLRHVSRRLRLAMKQLPELVHLRVTTVPRKRQV